MTETPEDVWMMLQGRLLAIEATMMELIWRWTLDQPHPTTALARILRSSEKSVQKLQSDPTLDRRALAAAQTHIRGMAESLHQALQQESVRRATDEDRGH